MINDKMHLLIGELSQLGVIISFNGSFTQGIIEEIGEAIKSYLDTEKEDNETKIHDTFAVYIEQAQNIKNYFLKKSREGSDRNVHKLAYESIIVIGKEEDNFYVCSGNLIENCDIEALKSSIDYLNSLSRDELRKYYKEKLRQDRSDDFGAGLGLIDMRKKAAAPLEYYFAERKNDYSFFTLKIVI
jgi:hypothetical protein